jgi:murein DD-endopeptidase MepM/ murein hydrolase activator NlpD
MKRFVSWIVPILIAFLLSACAGARVISGFGDLHDGEGRPRGRAHTGVDVWGNPGDTVLAAADAEVIRVAEEPTGLSSATCGKYVVLEHALANALIAPQTKYCHLATVTVKQGDHIKRGETIGTIGTTGWRRVPTTTTGFEHVHWELVSDRSLVDPLPFTVGCFDAKQTYPTDRLVLTYPVQCKN